MGHPARQRYLSGGPKGEKVIVTGDVLIAYGRADRLEASDRRRCGDEGEREYAAAKAE